MNVNVYNILFCKANICLIAKNNTEVIYNNGGEVLKNDIIKVDNIQKIGDSFEYRFNNCQTVVSFEYLYKNFLHQIV